MVDFNIRATRVSEMNEQRKGDLYLIQNREEERYEGERKVKQDGKNSRTRPHDSTSEGMEEEEKGVIE